jgi:predicted permease
MEQARLAMNALYKPIVNDVEAPLQKGMSDQTMAKFRVKELTLEEGRRGQSSVRQEARVPLLLLFGITGIVLLIACANIANLLLARSANRALEMAVRLSIGARRGQLLTQLLTESVLLAVLGGVASLVVASWTLSALAQMLPPDASGAFQFKISMPVVLFAAGLSIGTGLLFGMFPALHSTRPDLISTLRANTGQPSGARAAARFRTSLVTAQIALSMALLISAGLFIKSLRNVSRVDLGLQVDKVVTFGISPELNGYSHERSRTLFARVEEELAALPGVNAVSAGMVPLIGGSNWGTSASVEGFKRGPDTDTYSAYNLVGPGYFRTVGMTILSGREFTAADGLGSAPIAVVNEAFAKKFGLGRDAVGKHMARDGGEKLDIEIVGLVRNAKYSEVKDEIPPLFYTPYKQDSSVGRMNFYARAAGDPLQLLRQIPGVMAKLDPNLPVENLKTMPQQIKESIFLDRMISTLSAAFALLATLLAAVGLYGVLSYTVAQRTREIGVRMALGADAGRVRGMVLRQVGVMTTIGGLIGIAAAVGLGRAAQSLLFELKGYDPLVMGIAVVVLTLVALGAGYVPALRASKVEPMRALRYE